MPTVAVIGAGVAGLQACRALHKWGFDVLVLEQASSVGGVWSRNHAGYGIQVPRHLYQLAEFPWPEGGNDSSHCSGADVLLYLQSYVRHFALDRFIRFGCHVTMCSDQPSGGWQVAFHDTRARQHCVLVTDYLVIASGLYSSPRIPTVQGSSIFTGIHIHAKNFTDASIAAGKRVVIVGAGKTALDCAAEVAAGSCARTITWLFRKVHWPLPPQLTPRLSVQELLFSRLTSLLVEPYYTANTAQRVLASVLRPLKGAVWRYLEGAITRQFQLTGALMPTQSLQQDLLYSGQIVDAAWAQLIRKHAQRTRPALQRTQGSSTASSSSSNGRSKVAAGSSRHRGGGAQEQLPTARRNSSSTGRQEGHAAKGGVWAGLTGGWWRSRRQDPLPRSSSASGRHALARSISHTSGRGDTSRGRSSANSSTASRHSARSSTSQLGVVSPRHTSVAGASPADLGQVQSPRGRTHGSSPGMEEMAPPDSPSAADGSGARLMIVPKQGRVAHFTRRGLVLDDSSYLPADLVLYCTGYSKTYDYLPGSVKGRLGLKTDGLHLYRNIVPPAVTRLAFVGSEVSTFNNPLTSGLQAEWLAAHWAGGRALPEVAVMQADIKKQQEWRARLMPAQRHRGTVLQLYMSHYHSQLVTDLGLNPPRPGLHQLKVPLTAKDFAHVFQARSGGVTRQKSSVQSYVRSPSALFEVAALSPRATTPQPGGGMAASWGQVLPPAPSLSPGRRSAAGLQQQSCTAQPWETTAVASGGYGPEPGLQRAAGGEGDGSPYAPPLPRTRASSSLAGASTASEGGVAGLEVGRGVLAALGRQVGSESGGGEEGEELELSEAGMVCEGVCVEMVGVDHAGSSKGALAQEVAYGQKMDTACLS